MLGPDCLLVSTRMLCFASELLACLSLDVRTNPHGNGRGLEGIDGDFERFSTHQVFVPSWNPLPLAPPRPVLRPQAPPPRPRRRRAGPRDDWLATYLLQSQRPISANNQLRNNLTPFNLEGGHFQFKRDKKLNAEIHISSEISQLRVCIWINIKQ